MADETILAEHTGTAPSAYIVPAQQEIIPKAVTAVLDGTGASGDFYPEVVIESDAGVVVARAILQTTIAAGASAEVSWFPWVGGRSGGFTYPAPFPIATIVATTTDPDGYLSLGQDAISPDGSFFYSSLNTFADNSWTAGSGSYSLRFADAPFGLASALQYLGFGYCADGVGAARTWYPVTLVPNDTDPTLCDLYYYDPGSLVLARMTESAPFAWSIHATIYNGTVTAVKL